MVALKQFYAILISGFIGAWGVAPAKPKQVAAIAQVIGFYANGCIRNAPALSPEGPGYETVRFSRNRLSGHPSLMRYILALAKQTQKIWLFERRSKNAHSSEWVLGVGDLSYLTGGPVRDQHASHQNGLEGDFPYMPVPKGHSREERERMPWLSMVDTEKKVVNEHWSPKQALLLQKAALPQSVDRIFVNPVIKQEICKMRWPNRQWIRKLVPWYGHHDHFHVRLKCPKDSPHCQPQPPVGRGDRCGAELFAWLHPGPNPRNPSPSKSGPPPLHPLCQELMISTSVPTIEAKRLSYKN